MGETITATYSSSFRTGWTVFISAWIAVGLLLILFGLLYLWGLLIPGIALVAVFGWLLMVARHRFAKPGPVISIGPDGFRDRRLGKVIPWSEVISMKPHKSGSRIFLQIEVAEPGRFLGNAGILAKPMQRANPAMGFPALASNLSGMDVPQERLLVAAQAWHGANGSGISG